jgi:D-alanine-D-alanine ligase
MRGICALKSIQSPGSLRVLFLANYAPDFPDFAVKPFSGDGGYPEYHYQLFNALKKIGCKVWSTSKPYAIQFAHGNVDYVFSLMNRMPMLNSEIFVSSYCEFARIPYLGARPNIRALAEDKYLTKLAVQALHLPVAPGLPFAAGWTLPKEPPFDGPFFVKNRFGAASEGIFERNFCPDWMTVTRLTQEMTTQGDEGLIERFCEGIDVTVPVLGGSEPMVLGFVHAKSNKVGNIVTQDLKLDDHLGNEIIDVGGMEQEFHSDIAAIWRAFGPMDYFRVDYRVDLGKKRRWLLEINICCYLGAHGAICLAAEQHGLSRLDILNHIIGYSLERQKFMRQQCEWIL